MQEYVTRAVVLDKEMRNDADARYALFTERYGKIMARAKSSRKIVSKLAGHLEPGTLASVRIIETHGAQVVDALAAAQIKIPFTDLVSLNHLLGEWEPDVDLWRELIAVADAARGSRGAADDRVFSWSRMLAILGWDPRGAVCVSCHASSRPARHFYLPRQEFFCQSCAANIIRYGGRISRFGVNQVLLVDA
jgi:recombinational DNA repair protein (RecF pathway)